MKRATQRMRHIRVSVIHAAIQREVEDVEHGREDTTDRPTVQESSINLHISVPMLIVCGRYTHLYGDIHKMGNVTKVETNVDKRHAARAFVYSTIPVLSATWEAREESD